MHILEKQNKPTLKGKCNSYFLDKIKLWRTLKLFEIVTLFYELLTVYLMFGAQD